MSTKFATYLLNWEHIVGKGSFINEVSLTKWPDFNQKNSVPNYLKNCLNTKKIRRKVDRKSPINQINTNYERPPLILFISPKLKL